MIKFGNLIIENFLSVSRADLSLDNQGLVLIEGINEDDPSARSNGAGKSSVVDAISWVLFGETARGVTGDTVVNIKAGKGCYVAVQVEVDGKQYSIHRGRKHKELKNRVELREPDGKGGWIDHTAGTDKLTQEKINNLLGCSADIFNASIYMGQERMPDLPNMTDKALKAILEEALQLDRLDQALELVKGRIATVEYDQQRAWNTMERITGLIASHKKEQTWLEDSMKDEIGYLKRMQVDYKVLDEEGDVAEKDDANAIKYIEDQLAGMAPAKDSGDIVRELMMEKADRQRDESEPLMEQIKSLNEKHSDSRLRLNLAQSELSRTTTTDKCHTCGRPHEGVDPNVALSAAREAKQTIDMETELCADLRESIRVLSGKYDAARASIDAWFVEESAKRTDESRTRERTLEQLVRQREVAAARAAGHDRQLQMLERAITSKKDGLKTSKDRYKAIGNDMALLGVEYEATEVEHGHCSERLDTLEKVRHILGRKGFRGEVLDQITPYLNSRTAHYLTQLTDGNITAQWSTITQNSAGEYVESFHIDVTHASGVTKFNALSGGEKRKVRLATALALQDLVGTRAVKPIKLFVADEIDDAIDEAGLELLMGLLDQKAKEVGTVFVISHNDISDWVRNKITVVKSAGQTTFKTP